MLKYRQTIYKKILLEKIIPPTYLKNKLITQLTMDLMRKILSDPCPESQLLRSKQI
jgi:hypothetical protein